MGIEAEYGVQMQAPHDFETDAVDEAHAPAGGYQQGQGLYENVVVGLQPVSILQQIDPRIFGRWMMVIVRVGGRRLSIAWIVLRSAEFGCAP
jgi:hypothetical protein